MRGTERLGVSDSTADNTNSFSKKMMAGSSPPKAMGSSSLDMGRAESSRQHVRALNNEFASWVQTQLQNHPDELLEDRVRDYLTHASKKMMVHFRSLDRPKEDDFCLELSKLHTYDDVVKGVARKLNLDDPSKIRLTPHNCYSQQPKPDPIKYRAAELLPDMLVHYNQVSDILYYEVLDIPLPELQGLKTLKVAFHHATKEEPVTHNIRLAKQSTVGDVLDEIKGKVGLSCPNAELRLLEIFYHKIYKIFPLTEKIEHINDQYWTLRAEEIPEEEKNPGPQDRLIHVYHFTKKAAQNQMQVQNFGEPFLLIIHEDETLVEVKGRIQKKLGVPDEEFAKWKFAFLSLGRPEYLEDTDVVSHRFQRRDVYGAWEQYLGLEHSDTTPKRAFTSNQNSIDEDNLAELIGPDPRARPASKPRSAKKAKSVYTSSAGGSQSDSLTGDISEEYRRKCKAAEAAYEAQRKKELVLLECKELEFLTIDPSSLPPEKAAYIRRKQDEIMKKYPNA